MTIVITTAMTHDEAAAITREIAQAVKRYTKDRERIRALIIEAREREAWKALGCRSWAVYVEDNFGLSVRTAQNICAAEREPTQRSGRNSAPVETVDADTTFTPPTPPGVANDAAPGSEEDGHSETCQWWHDVEWRHVPFCTCGADDNSQWFPQPNKDDDGTPHTPSLTFTWQGREMQVAYEGMDTEMWVQASKFCADRVREAAAAAILPAPTQRETYASLLLTTLDALPAAEAKKFRRIHKFTDAKKWVAGLSDTEVASALRLLDAVEEVA